MGQAAVTIRMDADIKGSSMPFVRIFGSAPDSTSISSRARLSAVEASRLRFRVEFRETIEPRQRSRKNNYLCDMEKLVIIDSCMRPESRTRRIPCGKRGAFVKVRH